MEIAKIVKSHLQDGAVKFDGLLRVPLTDRIPALLAKHGDKEIHGIVTVMLQSFCNSFNVVRPMSQTQIVQCAYDIINDCDDDHLSIEDLTIFFQGAKKGIYGKPVFDRVDQQVIFQMLDDYRDKRHKKYHELKEIAESRFKKDGPLSRLRSSEDLAGVKDLFHSATKEFYSGQLDIRPDQESKSMDNRRRFEDYEPKAGDK